MWSQINTYLIWTAFLIANPLNPEICCQGFTRWMTVWTGQPAARGIGSRSWEQSQQAENGKGIWKEFLHSLLRCFHVKKHQSFPGLVRFKLTVLQHWLRLPSLFCEYVCDNLKLCLFIIKEHWTERTEFSTFSLNRSQKIVSILLQNTIDFSCWFLWKVIAKILLISASGFYRQSPSCIFSLLKYILFLTEALTGIQDIEWKIGPLLFWAPEEK